jgi:hypothetical protein
MRFLLALIATLFLNACVSNKPGEWMPLLENSSTSEELGKKYDVPNVNQVFDGLVYWAISPRIDTAPYAFHWAGSKLYIWEPNFEVITRHTLLIEECPNLEKHIILLLNEIANSAQLMTAKKHRNTDYIFSGHPIEHRIKYYPPGMLGSITLRNIEFYQMPWIVEAQKIREIAHECIK